MAFTRWDPLRDLLALHEQLGQLVGSDAPLRDRVRATTAVLSVGATCMFFLQEVNDRDKLRAIVLEMATDLIS